MFSIHSYISNFSTVIEFGFQEYISTEIKRVLGSCVVPKVFWDLIIFKPQIITT